MRKRTGNLETGKLFSHNGDKLTIFQNIYIPDYVKLVFGSISITAKLGICRKGLRKNMIHPMTKKKILELVDNGKKNLIYGTLGNNPYSDELMEKADNVRRAELIQGT